MRKPSSILLLPSAKALTLCHSGTAQEPPASFMCPNPGLSMLLQSTPNPSFLLREADQHPLLLACTIDPYSALLLGLALRATQHATHCWHLVTASPGEEEAKAPVPCRCQSQKSREEGGRGEKGAWISRSELASLNSEPTGSI